MITASVLTWFGGAGASSLPMLLDASIKGAAILVAAAAVATIMRRFSAASRQIVWVLAMAGLLALPALSLALPGWRVLPDWAKIDLPTAAQSPQRDGRPAEIAATGVRPQGLAPDSDSASPATASPGTASLGPALPVAPVEGSNVSSDAAQAPAAPVAQGNPPAAIAAPAAQPSWQAKVMPWAMCVWVLGAAIALVPLLLGRLSLWAMRWVARPATDEQWLALFSKAIVAVGVRRKVRLVEGPGKAMPMVWGVIAPRLLLPAEARNWSAARVWVVLLHELAHVRRWDCATKLLAHLACAMYWFNPLAWLAFKRLQMEGEAACDDLVLAAGNEPCDYADHLLHIASGLRAGLLTAHSSIAMAGKTKLEGRLLAILDTHRNRRALTRWGLLAAALVVAIIVVPISILKATGPAKPAAAPATGPAAQESSDAFPPESRDTFEVKGTVTLADGRKMPDGAFAIIKSQYNQQGSETGIAPIDNDGHFAYKMWRGTIYITPWVPGYAQSAAGPFEAKPGKDPAPVTLQASRGFTARIQFQSSGAGKPGAGRMSAWLSDNRPGQTVNVDIDKDGLATIPHRSAQPLNLEIFCPGFQYNLLYGVLPTEKTQILKLAPATPTSLLVVDEAGKPVADAKALMLSGGGMGKSIQSHDVWGSSDTRGNLVLDTLGDHSEYFFCIEANDHAPLIVGSIKPGDAPRKVALGPPIELAGEFTGDPQTLKTLRASCDQPYGNAPGSLVNLTASHDIELVLEGNKAKFRVTGLMAGPIRLTTNLSNIPVYATSISKTVEGLVISVPPGVSTTQRAGLNPTLAQKRDALLAQAEADIRSGLLKLADQFPQLKKGKGWETIGKASKPGGIDMFADRAFGPDTLGLPPGEMYYFAVIVKPPPHAQERFSLSPLYPMLGLDGTVNVWCLGDKNLDSALKKLATDALAPLENLEKQTACSATQPAVGPAGGPARGLSVKQREAMLVAAVNADPIDYDKVRLALTDVGNADVTFTKGPFDSSPSMTTLPAGVGVRQSLGKFHLDYTDGLNRTQRGLPPDAWLSKLSAGRKDGYTLWVATLAVAPTEEVRKERDRLLTEVDAKIRKGLLDLAKTFPQLQRTGYRTLAEELKEAKPLVGRVGIWAVRGTGFKAGTEPSVPPQNRYSILVVIEPLRFNGPDDEAAQLGEGLLGEYDNLALMGQVHYGADDPKLDAAVKKLIDGALAPLKTLNEKAAALNAGGAAEIPDAAPAAQAVAPILVLAMTSDVFPEAKTHDLASGIIQPRLSQLDGVGRVTVGAGAFPAAWGGAADGLLNGKPAVSISIFRKPGASIDEITGSVQAFLPALRNSIPQGMSLVAAEDSAAIVGKACERIRTRVAALAGQHPALAGVADARPRVRSDPKVAQWEFTNNAVQAPKVSKIPPWSAVDAAKPFCRITLWMNPHVVARPGETQPPEPHPGPVKPGESLLEMEYCQAGGEKWDGSLMMWSDDVQLIEAVRAIVTDEFARATTQPAATSMPVTQPAEREMTLDLGNKVTMKLVLIPAGKFLMGSPRDEKDRRADEGPQHEVTITEPFYMGVYAVTQEQYEQVTGNNPSNFKGPQNPVETVYWGDAVAFCRKLSEMTGKNVRLPTEAQWEYACRAGSKTRFYYGYDNDYVRLGDYAWCNAGPSKTHPVGQKKPNAWGLYDMCGNVSQWCSDWYADTYANAKNADPQGPDFGSSRILRGGNSFSEPHWCRSAARDKCGDFQTYMWGFRVVVDSASPAAQATRPASGPATAPATGPASAPAAASAGEVVGRICKLLTERLTEAAAAGEPSRVSAGGARLQCQEIRLTGWWRSMPQREADEAGADARFMKLSVEERMKHGGRRKEASESFSLWWTPFGAGLKPDDIKRDLSSTTQAAKGPDREMAYLGHDEKLAWFTCTPLGRWSRIQGEMKFAGGDDPVESAVARLNQHEVYVASDASWTQYDAVHILVGAGERGVAAIEKRLGPREATLCVRAMYSSTDPAITKFLVKCASSPDSSLAGEARSALIGMRRPEAAELYAKWLAEKAGKGYVGDLVWACKAAGSKVPADVLAKVIARPTTPYEYRTALELSRAQEGKAIPEKILQAQKTIYDRDSKEEIAQAVRALVRSDDPQYAGAIALEMALDYGMKRPPQVNDAGTQVLRLLPNGEGKRIVLLLESYPSETDPVLRTNEEERGWVKALADKFRD